MIEQESLINNFNDHNSVTFIIKIHKIDSPFNRNSFLIKSSAYKSILKDFSSQKSNLSTPYVYECLIY